MSNNTNRRDFIGYSFVAVAAVGGAASLYGMKKVWDPLPSVLAGGFTKIDLSALKAGEPETFTWRGKPIFVLKKTADMEDNKRDLVVGNDRFTVAIGLCTHLGCIPAWKKNEWKCACHGGVFNASGQQTFGPPPRPLDLPPFEVEGNTLVLGNEGPEYKKIAEAMMA
ncbi:ubiquinol-cytochrome c reductase iron-sulfur subunit [Aliarcobacter skirrowii]|jgi:ubiquinol-cytochrome c reductase iron-sulfur subunit|uniref:Ubiquinol cytochrome c oxidoreductase PetABC, [2Fe-2S] subunit n=2 Tax=Aliarcobacter skirrowii TaxID=28200 RepID=A0AAD0SK00_9BACT|nr:MULTISPECIES: Rieske 2Fe-2S domain-containing protein [Arcobacteraceae]AXX84127.1 ubiquinol cytochrome c oxidoreductase PetABC [2Fe-2S] subunit [Aliarcobacter skirrowii CCUG 10374]AZL53298.1 twin-arginine translocation signal domain-containing protein [Aliarcobacter skirrowii]KAB0621686.1 Rieske 2Fe-2S domain-containing protein [Aliarcobacter skirrowii CCUG 10374]MCT7445722.1 Rieske 2Fe-2S domain-containing protein [Aliarcobacter skirrowii]MDD2507784.1 Rieske 2Fe-2S domain-containing protei